jgi:hypothetical protein
MGEPITITNFIKTIDLDDYDDEQLKILKELFEEILDEIKERLE